jgi:hypothetical protein
MPQPVLRFPVIAMVEGFFEADMSLPTVTLGEGIQLGLFPIGVAIGLLLGLWRARFGGWIATLSLIAFYVGTLIDSGELPRGPWFIVFSGGGVALIVADAVRRRFATSSS